MARSQMTDDGTRLDKSHMSRGACGAWVGAFECSINTCAVIRQGTSAHVSDLGACELRDWHQS